MRACRCKRAAQVASLLAALLLTSPVAQAQTQTQTQTSATPAAAAAPAATPTPAPAGPPPTRVTLDEVSERAEDVATQLRDMTEAISDEGVFAALEGEVYRLSRRVGDRWRETSQMLSGPLRRNPLETIASSWAALRTEGVAIRERVDALTTRREADLAALDRMKETWSWTLDHADTVAAPAPVLGRVQETIAAIDATRRQVDARHSRLLVLQDTVSRSMQACDDATARVSEARRKAVDRIFSVHEPPLWNRLSASAPGGTRPSHPGLGAAVDAVQIYTQAYRSGFVLSALIGILLIWGLYHQRARAGRALGSAPLPEFVTYAFRRPIATALLLVLVVTRPLRPDPPAALQRMMFMVGVPASLSVLWPVLDPRIARTFLAFGVFFAVDLTRSLLRLEPVVEQWVLTLEMSAATAVLYWTASLLPTAVGPLVERSLWMRTIGRRVLLGASVATGVAAVAAALGYLELSDFVGGGALAVVYLGIGVLAFRVAAGGVLWLALVESPLARLRAVQRNRLRAEVALSRVIEAVSIVIWFVFMLQTFELLEPARSLAQSALDAKLQVGALSLSVGRVLGFGAVLAIAWLAARIIVFALEEDVYPRMRLARGIPYALSSMVRYGLLAAGFFAALATIGLDLTRLTVLVSAIGLGVGFGMQQIINNFVSGLILLFERPVQVGDQVQLKDLSGEVLRIGIRSSTICTPDGAEVIIPNSDLIQTGVTNWTLSDRRRRVTIDVRIAYGTPAERVIRLLLDVAQADARVLAAPATEALFTNFGDSGLEFQLRFWTEDPNWMQLKSDLGVRIQDALRGAAIGMPVTPVEVQIEGAGNGETG